MKKFCIISWIVALTCVVLALSFPIHAHAMYDKLYPTCGVVIEVDEDNDLVTFQDFTGNRWSFHGVEDWYVNDICACIMNDNGTIEIYDDIIVSTQYCGWV